MEGGWGQKTKEYHVSVIKVHVHVWSCHSQSLFIQLIYSYEDVEISLNNSMD